MSDQYIMTILAAERVQRAVALRRYYCSCAGCDFSFTTSSGSYGRVCPKHDALLRLEFV